LARKCPKHQQRDLIPPTERDSTAKSKLAAEGQIDDSTHIQDISMRRLASTICTNCHLGIVTVLSGDNKEFIGCDNCDWRPTDSEDPISIRYLKEGNLWMKRRRSDQSEFPGPVDHWPPRLRWLVFGCDRD
jgi:hypothetical protein